MAECKAEVKALKAALEKAGVRVIVVGELPGEDLLEAVVQGMDEADLFIIMGTETYGRRTNDLFDTRKEMQQIISSKMAIRPRKPLPLHFGQPTGCMMFPASTSSLEMLTRRSAFSSR